MWKWTRKDENKPVPPSGTSGRPSAAPPAVSLPSQEPVQKILTPQAADGFHPDVTHIGKSIVIKGELSGSGNVYLDGELEGSVELLEANLTVGPDGRIRANVQARSIVVHGRMDGNLYGIKRVELKKSAVVVGDIYTPRIVIEDGVSLKGSVLVQKDIPRPQTKKKED